MRRFRRSPVDLSRLPLMVARGLSDSAIARVFGCSREHVWDLRHRLGLASRHGLRRRTEIRARHAELDRLWSNLTLDEKVRLLLSAQS